VICLAQRQAQPEETAAYPVRNRLESDALASSRPAREIEPAFQPWQGFL